MNRKLKRASSKFELPKQKEPRQLPEIQAEYTQSVTQAGQLQYQLFVLETELAQLNKKLLELNHEGAARKQIDDKAAETKTEEVEK